jgi:hypothetical protein
MDKLYNKFVGGLPPTDKLPTCCTTSCTTCPLVAVPVRPRCFVFPPICGNYINKYGAYNCLRDLRVHDYKPNFVTIYVLKPSVVEELFKKVEPMISSCQYRAYCFKQPLNGLVIRQF